MGILLNHNNKCGTEICYPTDEQQYVAILGKAKDAKSPHLLMPLQNGDILQSGDIIHTYNEHDVIIMRNSGIEDYVFTQTPNTVYYESTLSPMLLNEKYPDMAEKLEETFKAFKNNWQLPNDPACVYYITPSNASKKMLIDFEVKHNHMTITFKLEIVGGLYNPIAFAKTLKELSLQKLEASLFEKFIRTWMRLFINQLIQQKDETFDFVSEWTQAEMSGFIYQSLTACGYNADSLALFDYEITSNIISLDDIYVDENEKEEEPEPMEHKEPIVEESMENTWVCTKCDFDKNTGKFCKSCGNPKEEVPTEEGKNENNRTPWNCLSCNTLNDRNFCYACGRQKPIKVVEYKCQKCNWVPDEHETFTPNYCPECGDKIEEEDIIISYI